MYSIIKKKATIQWPNLAEYTFLADLQSSTWWKECAVVLEVDGVEKVSGTQV